MCGINISQIFYNQKKDETVSKLFRILNNIKVDPIKIIDYCYQLKSNNIYINLVKYTKNNKNKKEITNSLKIIKRLLKKKNNLSIIDKEIYLDCISIISSIEREAALIKAIIEENELKVSNNLIIFLKSLIQDFDSLNYIESRGRDSASITIRFVYKGIIYNDNEEIYNKNEINIFNQKINNHLIRTYTFKTAKRIGKLGDNIKDIFNLILKSKLLIKENFEKIYSTIILSHTRWASIGDVNLSNCHPLILKNKNLILMNGDIKNFQNFIKIQKSKDIDNACTNDLSIFQYNDIEKILKLCQGSFVIIYFKKNDPSKLIIEKKGEQGFYYGQNSDNDLVFSSDVYGLVNKTNYFVGLNKNQKIKINISNNKIINLNKEIIRTDINSRDLDKGNFEFHYLKEISDTGYFIEKTISKLIDFKKNNFKEFDHNFYKNLVKELRQKKIKNIILSGMGSCFTAAYGISKYINQKFDLNHIEQLNVSASIATENTGFMMKKNMSDTLVIIIAQSGTTIETNYFAKYAKNRGAKILSIVNKRNGDITFIADKNLYLGDGRDIEIAVPSSKSYSCHLITGFILLEYLIGSSFKNKKRKLSSDYKFKLTNTFEKIYKFQRNLLSKVKFDIANRIYVLYDSTTIGFNAVEARIKFSECCYQTVVHMHLNDFEKIKINNSTIIFFGNDINKINFLNNNQYFIISLNSKNRISDKNIFYLPVSNRNKIKSIIESNINFQLLAYFLAKKIETTKINKIKQNPQNFLDYFKLKKFINLNDKSQKDFITKELLRPIDCIKHQAKTITVGATRGFKIHKNKFHLIKKINNKDIPIKEFNTVNLNYKNVSFSIAQYCDYLIKEVNSIRGENIKVILSESILFKNNSNKLDIQLSNFFKKNISDCDGLINFYQYLTRIKFNDNDLLINKDIHEIIKLKKILNSTINQFKNIKFLGSGHNYITAKYLAQKISGDYNKSISYDIIENHKHIDISSESLLLIFILNDYNLNNYTDFHNEIEKFIAHNNYPIIITNKKTKVFNKFENTQIDKYKINIIRLSEIDKILELMYFSKIFI